MNRGGVYIRKAGGSSTYHVSHVSNSLQLPKLLMALKKAMEGLMGSKTVAQLRIQEHNEEAVQREIFLKLATC